MALRLVRRPSLPVKLQDIKKIEIMKFNKTLILTGLLALGGLTASAQEQEKTENVFNPHWYIEVQPLGMQYTLGEVSFGDLLSYNLQVAGGYNFNPVVGARLSVNMFQSKAGWKMDGQELKWKWNYVAPMVDVTANLSNLFCGYNPTRLFNFSVFAGIGMNIGFGNDEAADAKAALNEYYKTDAGNLAYLWDGTKVRFAGRLGVKGDFRINDQFSVGLELQATTLSDHYNSKRAGNSDWYFNALVGVKYNFGKTYTTRKVKSALPPERVVERVIEKVVEKPAQTTEQAAAVREPMRRDVFFVINSTKICDTEQLKVKEIADYLKKYPEAKVEITGYSDKGTGNASINKRLSDKRADIVKTTLVEKYGISSSRITTDSKGDTVQPFEKNNLNRVSICIAK